MTGAHKARAEPAIGSRVQVMSADGIKELGFGTYMGRVSFGEVIRNPDPSATMPLPPPEERTGIVGAFIEEMAKVMTADDQMTPRIVLDSGETVYGFQCWWSVVEQQSAGKLPPIGTVEAPTGSFS
ncbi:MAG: hypothetical protein WC050_01610 [Candidatus Paceibacterota bacterium]